MLFVLAFSYVEPNLIRLAKYLVRTVGGAWYREFIVINDVLNKIEDALPTIDWQSIFRVIDNMGR